MQIYSSKDKSIDHTLTEKFLDKHQESVFYSTWKDLNVTEFDINSLFPAMENEEWIMFKNFLDDEKEVSNCSYYPDQILLMIHISLLRTFHFLNVRDRKVRKKLRAFETGETFCLSLNSSEHEKLELLPPKCFGPKYFVVGITAYPLLIFNSKKEVFYISSTKSSTCSNGIFDVTTFSLSECLFKFDRITDCFRNYRSSNLVDGEDWEQIIYGYIRTHAGNMGPSGKSGPIGEKGLKGPPPYLKDEKLEMHRALIDSLPEEISLSKVITTAGEISNNLECVPKPALNNDLFGVINDIFELIRQREIDPKDYEDRHSSERVTYTRDKYVKTLQVLIDNYVRAFLKKDGPKAKLLNKDVFYIECYINI